MSTVITIDSLDMRYNGEAVLKELNLAVPEGSVYAFLGRNGSGKTTTIKILLGLLDQEAGSVKVLGLDPVRDAKFLMQDIGYVSEDRVLYEWMTAGEMIRFTAAFYQNWDSKLAADLAKRLKIRSEIKISKMSRGQKGKLCLLLALAYRPRLLILDEPTAGLDSVVRRQFIEETIELISEEGRTVFFSTHLIDEVERVADRVGILTSGTLAMETNLQNMKENTRRITVFCHDDAASLETAVTAAALKLPEGVLNLRTKDRALSFITTAYSPEMAAGLEKQNVKKVQVEDMSLDDIFVELTREEDE